MFNRPTYTPKEKHMKEFCDRLYQETCDALGIIRSQNRDILRRSELSFRESLLAYQKLKGHITGHRFRDDGEEIAFYKDINPLFVKDMIYFSEIFTIETGKPLGSHKKRKQFYQKAMDRVGGFFKRNREFYLYYRMGKTELDEKLFLARNNPDLLFPDTCLVGMDTRFGTPCSYRVAKILAYEKLNVYLQQAVDNLEGEGGAAKRQPDTVWTGNKVWLIELVYAFYASGVVNKGNVELKDIVHALEEAFGIRLGEFYRTFQEIRIRKKNRTVFLDHLKERLENYMEESDR